MLFLIGIQTSITAMSNEDELPGFDVLTPPNNSEALDFRRGYSNGFTESAWHFDIPDNRRVETSSQFQGNDFFYSHPNGDLQNASFSCRNDSKKISIWHTLL